MFCERCGARLSEGVRFCGSCGAKTGGGRDEGFPGGGGWDAGQAMAPECRPLSVGQYIGMFLLMGIPLVNLILLLVWGFGGAVNLNRKNYARAALILAAAAVVFWLILGFSLLGSISDFINGLDGAGVVRYNA